MPGNLTSLAIANEPNGTTRGRLPSDLTEADLAELGHSPMRPLKLIRHHCIDCSGGELGEVRKCTAFSCALWPYRMGTNPFRRKDANAANE